MATVMDHWTAFVLSWKAIAAAWYRSEVRAGRAPLRLDFAEQWLDSLVGR